MRSAKRPHDAIELLCDRFCSIKTRQVSCQGVVMVRSRRLELPRVAPQRPQRCASTNSATTARGRAGINRLAACSKSFWTKQGYAVQYSRRNDEPAAALESTGELDLWRNHRHMND